MAASKMKNDFAPAWLKLPNQENLKPTPPRINVDRAYERSFSERTDVFYEPAAFDDFNSTPRVPRPRSNSTRGVLTNGYRSGNNTAPRPRVKQGRSNRSYNQVNGADCCEMSAISRPAKNPSTASKQLSERFVGSDEGSHNGGGGQKDQTNNVAVDEEFPSLNGDAHSQSSKPTYSKVASVWDGSVRESTTTVRSPVTPELGPKPLILKTNAVKRTVVDVDKLPKPFGIAADNSKLAHRNGHKDQPQPTVMLTAKVLSACLKQPRESTDRKSNFFRLMRRESHESPTDLNHADSPIPSSPSPVANGKIKLVADHFMSNGTNGESNGRHEPTLQESSTGNAGTSSPAEVVFSSEGELRLMQEMGWNEADYDGEDYEITDDDIREFQALCHRLQQEQLSYPRPRSNSFAKAANGYVARILNSLAPQPSSSYITTNITASSIDSDFSGDDCSSSDS